MSKIQVYCRADGSIGIRNHLFILPAVVCANQVAIDVARRNPKFKYIEHQHGCAQIGADLVQTQRVFSNLALHPNVYASLFVGLGCEGIIAKDLYQTTKSRTQKPIGFVSIQGAGGTLKAQASVERWLSLRDAEIAQIPRAEVEWEKICIGFLFDDPIRFTPPAQVLRVLGEFWEMGANLVLPDDAKSYVAPFPAVNQVDHGEQANGRVTLMKAGSNALETATGMTAAGAHVIVHFAVQPHAFGTPLLPVLRFATSETTFQACPDDFDGQLLADADVDLALDEVHRVLEGKPTVAETLGMDDFALYRIGPTV
ncbi:UxaA family hydrolase [Alicyclobacillus fastidiosus]|uniref:UxaA family hydrolase n=1 Tax=Alicyclobacillus fastidiosus TaxID=392011 RepID=A0ABV5AJW9_9BACL|nr:UxaA family hydrolase [Alicyclobacillus fastidiosus]WEH08257.1 UxaA family hydrolase [Alicyclobacillus fastidiosus]